MTTPEPIARQWTRTISCEDSFGRPCVLLVSITAAGRIAVSPAGETAIMRSGQLQVLRDAINEARTEAADRNVERQES